MNDLNDGKTIESKVIIENVPSQVEAFETTQFIITLVIGIALTATVIFAVFKYRRIIFSFSKLRLLIFAAILGLALTPGIGMYKESICLEVVTSDGGSACSTRLEPHPLFWMLAYLLPTLGVGMTGVLRILAFPLNIFVFYLISVVIEKAITKAKTLLKP